MKNEIENKNNDKECNMQMQSRVCKALLSVFGYTKKVDENDTKSADKVYNIEETLYLRKIHPISKNFNC